MNILLFVNNQIFCYINNDWQEINIIDNTNSWYVFYTKKPIIYINAICMINLKTLKLQHNMYKCGEYTLHIDHNSNFALTMNTLLNNDIIDILSQYTTFYKFILLTDINYIIIQNILFKIKYYFLVCILLLFIYYNRNAYIIYTTNVTDAQNTAINIIQAIKQFINT